VPRFSETLRFSSKLVPVHRLAGRTAAFLVRVFSAPLMERSNSCARTGGHSHAVEDQTVRGLADSSVLMPAYSL